MRTPSRRTDVTARACVAHIGPRQRRQRLVFGVIALAVALLLLP